MSVSEAAVVSGNGYPDGFDKFAVRFAVLFRLMRCVSELRLRDSIIFICLAQSSKLCQS